MALIQSKHDYIKKVTQRILGLPPLPTLVAKLIEMVDDPRTNASNLARLISTDQVLTARVLRLANSAFYGFSRRIATVNLAIVVLGFETIKDLCVSVALQEWFTSKDDAPLFDMSRFWEHSIGCGIAGRMIARILNYRHTGDIFVAGLLHDIGKLVMKRYLKEEFRQV